MSSKPSPQLISDNEFAAYSKDIGKIALGERGVSLEASSIDQRIDILGLQDTNPNLNMKMHLVNNVRRYPERPLFSCASGDGEPRLTPTLSGY
jgi:hypothetical protein